MVEDKNNNCDNINLFFFLSDCDCNLCSFKAQKTTPDKKQPMPSKLQRELNEYFRLGVMTNSQARAEVNSPEWQNK